MPLRDHEHAKNTRMEQMRKQHIITLKTANDL